MKRLDAAIRQFRHNNSDDFVMGYDIAEVDARLSKLEEALKSFKKQYRNSPWIARIVDEALAE